MLKNKTTAVIVGWVCGILAIVLFVINFVITSTLATNDYSKRQCHLRNLKNYTEGDICYLWRDDFCRIGKVEDGWCWSRVSGLLTMSWVFHLVFLLVAILCCCCVGEKGKYRDSKREDIFGRDTYSTIKTDSNPYKKDRFEVKRRRSSIETFEKFDDALSVS